MSNDKTIKNICLNCGKETNTQFIKTKEPFKVRGEEIELEVEYLKCLECGNEFRPPKSTVDPIDQAYREYRKRHSMLQPEEIREHRERYGLTQQEMSKLLGWGFAKAAWGKEIDGLVYPGTLGLSPLDLQEFTYGAFTAILERNANKMLKAVLMDQRQVAGIGNGYNQEILFRARLHPKRKAGSLSDTERRALYRVLMDTIQQAVQQRGSDREFDLYGTPGGYHRLLGQQMKGQPCPVCATMIEKISVAGGSVYICPNCQK